LTHSVLKVSVDQLSRNLYIPINDYQSTIINLQSTIINPEGGGEDISLFYLEETGGQKETSVKYRQSQE
jgi:hypothetical protein